MHHADMNVFDRRQRDQVPRVALDEKHCVRRPPPAVPGHCYATNNPWNNIAGHLIWLGAGEIASCQVRSGLDPNLALARAAAIIKGPGSYEDREAAVAHELERAFIHIALKDGTRAGPDVTH